MIPLKTIGCLGNGKGGKVIHDEWQNSTYIHRLSSLTLFQSVVLSQFTSNHWLKLCSFALMSNFDLGYFYQNLSLDQVSWSLGLWLNWAEEYVFGYMCICMSVCDVSVSGCLSVSIVWMIVCVPLCVCLCLSVCLCVCEYVSWRVKLGAGPHPTVGDHAFPCVKFSLKNYLYTTPYVYMYERVTVCVCVCERVFAWVEWCARPRVNLRRQLRGEWMTYSITANIYKRDIQTERHKDIAFCGCINLNVG